MRRTPVALVTLAASLLLAACVGDREGTPLSGPASRSIGAAPPAATCSFSTLTKDAQTFFSDKKDSVFVIINDFQSTYTRSGAAAATPRGVDVLREVAAARLTSRQINGSDGGQTVVDVFLCTNLESIDLTSASTALSSGIFEIRGGGPAEPAALNEPATTPRWGVEPRFSLDWPTSQPGLTPAQPRYLVFGYPTSASTLGLPPADGFTGFEVATRSSIGTTVDKNQLRVGACILGGEGPNANRLIHGGVIIPNESPNFCATAVTSADKKSTTWLASFAHSVTSLITPTPLYAKTTLLDGEFTGGGMGGWSPMGFGAIPIASIVLGFDRQPVNSVASNDGTNDSVVVKATINNKPVPDVGITLTIAGNNGTPANAILYPASPHGVTGADGTVKIYFSAGKAGGYTITANGALEGQNTQSVISKLFNIKNP